jgi:hypothetical protein
MIAYPVRVIKAVFGSLSVTIIAILGVYSWRVSSKDAVSRDIATLILWGMNATILFA